MTTLLMSQLNKHLRYMGKEDDSHPQSILFAYMITKIPLLSGCPLVVIQISLNSAPILRDSSPYLFFFLPSSFLTFKYGIDCLQSKKAYSALCCKVQQLFFTLEGLIVLACCRPLNPQKLPLGSKPLRFCCVYLLPSISKVGKLFL